MNGVERIAAERRRQIEHEGWTPEHDDGHHRGDLAAAARSYILYAWWKIEGDRCGWTPKMAEEIVLERDLAGWPFDETWWKPSDDPIRNLEKAGALIAAEIDLLLRRRANVTHPSMEGLHRAVAEALRTRWREFENGHGEALPMPTAAVAVDAVFVYLTEHGVGWFGEGLVRATKQTFLHKGDGFDPTEFGGE